MIETRLLEYFLVLSHQKNISQAAKSLYISQSTLSKQMMELEEKLGKQLFIRGKKKNYIDPGRNLPSKKSSGNIRILLKQQNFHFLVKKKNSLGKSQ